MAHTNLFAPSADLESEYPSMALERDGAATDASAGLEQSASELRSVSVLVNFTLHRRYIDALSFALHGVRVFQAYEPLDNMDKDANTEWRKKEGAELDDLLNRAEVLFTFRFPIDWIERAPNLKWIQLASAGSDFIQREGLFDKRPDLLLTTASGVHEVPISEHILASILYFSRGLNIAVRNQAKRSWERYEADEAYRKLVCMVGYGPIARKAASLCKALGMRVVSVRASIAEQQAGFEAVERFYPSADLNSVLRAADYVVVAAPRTPMTEGMIGAAQFEAMKESAVLINISRAALIDEPALISALQEGQIRGAALDVFAQEPLPADSPLWDMPNVLVTPHIAGSNPHYDSRVTELFCDNLNRYLNNEPLRNLVVKERGY